MSATAKYLEENFVPLEVMTGRIGVSPEALEAFVSRGLVPAPSYKASEGRLRSAAFGELVCEGLIPGLYFHREMDQWIRDAHMVVEAVGLEAAGAILKTAFIEGAVREGEALSRKGLIPVFEDDQNAQASILEGWWVAHLAGIFGICVRRPGSLAEIVRKEKLQSALSSLTGNGTRKVWTASEIRVLTPLIQQYADACAPFAPVEYPLSSRKRFVEDLPARLALNAEASALTDTR